MSIKKKIEILPITAMRKAQVAGDGPHIVRVRAIVIDALIESSLIYLIDYDYEHRFAENEHEFSRTVDIISSDFIALWERRPAAISAQSAGYVAARRGSHNEFLRLWPLS